MYVRLRKSFSREKKTACFDCFELEMANDNEYSVVVTIRAKTTACRSDYARLAIEAHTHTNILHHVTDT